MRFFIKILSGVLISSQFAFFANADDTVSTSGRELGAEQVSELSDSDKLIKYLLEHNPFGTDASSDAAAGALAQVAEPPKGLELRSIFCVDGKWFFSLADTVSKTFYTIPLGRRQPDRCPYTIDFFDDESNSVSISNNVGSYTLTLKVQDIPSGKIPSMTAKGTAKTSTNRPANSAVPSAQATGQPQRIYYKKQ